MQRRYWGTKGPKIVRSRPSKTTWHEKTDLELDALADGEPVKGVTDKIGDMVRCMGIWRRLKIGDRT